MCICLTPFLQDLWFPYPQDNCSSNSETVHTALLLILHVLHGFESFSVKLSWQIPLTTLTIPSKSLYLGPSKQSPYKHLCLTVSNHLSSFFLHLGCSLLWRMNTTSILIKGHICSTRIHTAAGKLLPGPNQWHPPPPPLVSLIPVTLLQPQSFLPTHIS